MAQGNMVNHIMVKLAKHIFDQMLNLTSLITENKTYQNLMSYSGGTSMP